MDTTFSPMRQSVYCTPADGYYGIWHGQTPQDDPYLFKYSGGLGTYCAKHRPMAIYRPQVNRTFFVWGGTPRDGHRRRLTYRGDHQAQESFRGPGQLLHMVSCYDHATGRLARPTILLDKGCGDPHDNPVLGIDDEGYLWVFSPSHGRWTTPSFISRSHRPYAFDRFTTWPAERFAYPQPWHLPGKGWAFVHTRYHGGRHLYAQTSVDGRTWSPPVHRAAIEQGHYEVSALHRPSGALVSAFNVHPAQGGLERRTHLYAMRSDDLGEHWTTIDGRPLSLPLTDIQNEALAVDYRSQGRRVYLKDITFDQAGRPVVLYLTSADHRSGPAGDPRVWTVARWTGSDWALSEVTTSHSNYDTGSIDTSDPADWRIVAPTADGPQPYNPGGEMVLWSSLDRGATWQKRRILTAGSARNHTYARRVIDAREDFYMIWADGDCQALSQSSLYFCTRDGRVYRMPREVPPQGAEPEPVDMP